MFEPWIRSFDSAAGACIGACTEYIEAARSMMERGAHEGHQLGGVPGSLIGGTIGWAYGGLIGSMAGMAHGAALGAKAYTECKDAPAAEPPGDHPHTD